MSVPLTTVKARISGGLEIEGTVEDVLAFTQKWFGEHGPVPRDKSTYSPGPFDARPYETNYRLPCDQPDCKRRFRTEGGLRIHLTVSHHVPPKAHDPEEEHPERETEPELKSMEKEKVVLSRLYGLPVRPRDYTERGKTALRLSREVAIEAREIPKVLGALLNKGLVIEVPNPFDKASPLYFRKA